MKKCMASKICRIFDCDVKFIWDLTTDPSHYEWRSDLSLVQFKKNSKYFIEYYKNGNINEFKILDKDKYKFYRLAIKNKKFIGRLEFEFYPIGKNKTKVIFCKKIYVKNPIKRFFAKYLWDIKKLHLEYVNNIEDTVYKYKTFNV